MSKKQQAGEDGNEEVSAQPARFEEALRELETLVETLEQGDLSLDESLSQFERGVKLARECRDSLAAAEHRVQVLLQDEDGNESLEPLDSDPADEDR